MEMNENSSGTPKNLKYSTIGILSFVFCFLALTPIALNILTGGLFGNILKFLNINAVMGIWLIIFILAAFVLSIIDLRKPNRLKGLSKAALIISSIFVALFILITLTLYFVTLGPSINSPSFKLLS